MVVKPAEHLRSLLQRWLDSASEAADVVAHKLSVAADPRARQMRKRKWALRLGLAFGAACLLLVGVTAVLASWSVPAWALLIPGLLAAGAAFPATLLLLRYRWLRATPLPPQRPATARRLPPAGSAARSVMSALVTSERGLISLLGVIERGNLLPTAEVRELTGAANHSAATMAATAAEVVSMERAVQATPQSRSYLVPTINAFTAQLGAGVRQYNEMVTAAAHLVSTASSATLPGSPMSQQRYRDELAGATDRLLGWAQAFDELGRLRGA
jgi:hypothetical protein